MSSAITPEIAASVNVSPGVQVIELETVAATPEMLPLTAERKTIFLNTLIETGGNMSKAATLLGMTRHNVYRWVQSDPVFAELYEHALEHGTDNLEERAYVRAMDTSDRMMELLLKARRPEKYREQYKVEMESNLSAVDVSRLGDSLLAAMMQASARMREAQVDQQQVQGEQPLAITDGPSAPSPPHSTTATTLDSE